MSDEEAGGLGDTATRYLAARGDREMPRTFRIEMLASRF